MEFGERDSIFGIWDSVYGMWDGVFGETPLLSTRRNVGDQGWNLVIGTVYLVFGMVYLVFEPHQNAPAFNKEEGGGPGVAEKGGEGRGRQ